MRRRVIMGITILCLLFLIGDIVAIIYIQHTTSELITLIEPHEVEMMRQQLDVFGTQIQSNIMLFNLQKPEDLVGIQEQIGMLREAVNTCTSCHHPLDTVGKQERIRDLIDRYEHSLNKLTNSTPENLLEARTEAIRLGVLINSGMLELSKTAYQLMQERESEIIAKTHSSWIIFVVTMAFGLLTAFYVAYSFSRRLLSPMDTLLMATKRIANGDLSYKAQIDSGDEFEELAASFNKMTENLQNSYDTISKGSAQIKETRDYLAALISSMDDSVIVVNRDYRITDFNPAFLNLIKLPEATIRNQRMDEIHFHLRGEKIYPFIDHPIKEVFQTGKSIRAINSQVITSGEERSFEITASPILAGDEVDKVLEVIRDITERIEMQKAILLRDKELKDTQDKMVSSERLRALGEMAAGIAHGFNNILSGILGNIQNLLEEVKDLELKSMLKLIENATLDGAEIVRRIQEFSRVRKGGIYEEVSINEIIEDTMKITEAKWKNEAASWGIRFDFETDFSKNTILYANPSELREAFTNIFLNAFEAMTGGGKIFVSTKRINDDVIVIIEDTGKGMDEITAKKIFDPFFTTKGVKGTGLGLSITYGIVTRHDGKIEASSSPGKGTRFKITLPVRIPEKLRKQRETPSKIHTGSILIIDDEPMILKALNTMLERAGHSVSLAPDGQTGLNMLEENEYNVVITDLGMQDISGWEITKYLRTNRSMTKIIMLTGWGFQLDADRTRDAGVDILISKPFTKDQIIQSINKLLSSEASKDGA